MGGLLQWTEGQPSTWTPPSSPCLHCNRMRRDGGGAFSGPTDNDSGYSRGPSARITANLTSLAQSRSPPCLTSITKRNQQRKLLWLVLLLAGVLQVTALSPPGLVKNLGVLQASSLNRRPQSIHPTADLLGLPPKNPKPDHASHLPRGHTILRGALVLPCL